MSKLTFEELRNEQGLFKTVFTIYSGIETLYFVDYPEAVAPYTDAIILVKLLDGASEPPFSMNDLKNEMTHYFDCPITIYTLEQYDRFKESIEYEEDIAQIVEQVLFSKTDFLSADLLSVR